MQQQSPPEHRFDAVIVGGGITGLSAAWYLEQQDRHLEYALLESANRWGGFLRTEKIDSPSGRSFIVDAGPESFITRKPEAWELTKALHLEERVVDTGSETRDMFVLAGGKPVAVPLAPAAFIRSNLLSTRGKLRLLAEPFIAPKRDDEDESLGDFVRRRLGQEALDRFVGPILAGIYNTAPETQSILTTSPVMREMERESGSLFRAALQRLGNRKRQKQVQPDLPPRFFTFRDGAQELVDALVRRLRGDLQPSCPVQTILPDGNGFWVVRADGTWISTRTLILATPANVSAHLLQTAAPDAAAALGRIRYGDIGTISLAYRASDLQTRFPFNGLMVPRREGRAVDAVVWTSAKLPGRAPDGHALFRVFFGGAAPEMVDMDDENLLFTVRSELQKMLGLEGYPLGHRIFRWPASFPQADVGHLGRVEQIEALLPDGIALAGSAYRGIGVPDCIRQGKHAACYAVEQLQSTMRVSPATVVNP